ncbi:RAD26-like SNF2 family DNA-dependent ATPase [Hysterangium stoloniferum]|nr:RAD26-like SNF2 family DNA-dependent ATPase [Hysterangium stoloniferum]
MESDILHFGDEEEEDEALSDEMSEPDFPDKKRGIVKSRYISPIKSTVPMPRHLKADKAPERSNKADQDDSVTDDSATEPDSENHETISVCHNPRPDFTSVSSQPDVGPLILDQTNGIQVNASINRWLRDYQREGVHFFYERYKEGRGGILGDDMGLGKTIQVIAFLSAIMKKTGDDRDLNRRQEHVGELQDAHEWRRSRRLPRADATWPTSLIIVPSTVVHNWERELETWGYFETGIYAGSPKERAPVLRDFELGRLDIVVTSFATALKDIDLLESKAWSCVFVDEAHRVKNANSQTRIAFSRFDCLVRFGLTGTAIQNNYTEFWNILDWSNPGRLGTLSQWNTWVTRPLIRGQDSKATPEQVANGRVVAERLVTKLLPKFFKRRFVNPHFVRDIIADQLPKKIDQVVFCPLTEMQKQVYKNFLATDQVQVMLRKDEICDKCNSGKLSWVFENMAVLMKISNHLALILPAPIDNPEQTQRHREQANIAWPPVNGVPTAPSYGEAVFDPRLCGKWKVLKDLLTIWRKEGDTKVLIFTKSVKLLEMLEQRLKESFMEYRKLDGSVKQADRMTVVDQFNDDPDVFVFLISIMAGGVGLNLVAANKVVIFDPNWNPAHDLQAQDRAFRFGQRRDVSVYRLLGAGSLEELIYKRQIYKQQQMKIGYEASHQTRYFEGVQGDKSKQGELFGIKNIFTLDESGTTTKFTIERSHLAELDWALTNLEGKSTGKSKKTDNEVCPTNAEGKPELRGLSSLFFGDGKKDYAVGYLELTRFVSDVQGEDSLPQLDQQEDEIHRLLNSNGIRYTHQNDALLRDSAIETRIAKKAIEKKRSEDVKRARKGKGKQDPEPDWPPKRRHHKPQMPRLERRIDALIMLGHINSPEDFYKIADKFREKPEHEQVAFLGELDEEFVKIKAAEHR